ncbi:MAG TPA: polyhydroxyalkanoate depolymerase [Trinickia sp.]|jgi:polyhydroxyalkanoate depolymerase|nr:polyhydroxyalkanoate depolymerase [Trinickia sp.]
MLYQWLETQRALMRSIDAWAAFAGGAWHPAGENVASAGMRGAVVAVPGSDWLYRLLRSAPEPPPFNIASVSIGGRHVKIAEDVADRTAFCALRRFARVPADGESLDGIGASVLLCTPLAGHHAVMLRETVEALLEDADVYVTDWANARDVPLSESRFGLDDYVLALERFMGGLADEGLHVLAVCQATAPTVAAAALVASAGGTPPRSLTLMGGPIDTRLNPTGVDRFAVAHSLEWFRNTVIDTVPPHYAGAGRRIYPGYLQHAAIVAAHPHRQLALEARYLASRLTGDAAQTAATLRALDEYGAVLDMDEDYFLETLSIIFQEQRLARGTWEVDGRHVRPQTLAATALCTVEGDRDDITGAGQTHAAHALCSAVPDKRRLRFTIADCDHYDLFTGPRWRDTIHPALQQFWRAIGEGSGGRGPALASIRGSSA